MYKIFNYFLFINKILKNFKLFIIYLINNLYNVIKKNIKKTILRYSIS